MKYSYSKETEEKAINLFDLGYQIKQISEQLNLTKSTARLLIKRSGRIPILRAYQEQNIKTNPFVLKTEESDYWLGYFLADGWISTHKNSVGICTMFDPEHFKGYASLLENKVDIKQTKSATGIKHNIVFGNHEVKNYLMSIGVTSNKSHDLKLSIPLNSHILRGYFDGDGSISQGIPKFTCSSLDFCMQVREFLDSYHIETVLSLKDKTKPKCYDVRVKGDGRFLFYNLLYKDSTVFLARKRDKYRSALKQFKVKNIGLIAGTLPFITEEISSQA